MTKISFKLGIICIFSILMSSITGLADSNVLETTKVGVKKGDTFSFVLEKYSGYPEGIGKSLGYANGTSVRVNQGDEFTLTIYNATPDVISNESYTFESQIQINGGTTYIITIGMKVIGVQLLLLTDWEYRETSEKQELDELKQGAENAGQEFSYSITNGADIFSVTSHWEWVLGDLPKSTKITEKVFDKTTGILLLDHEKTTVEGVSGSLEHKLRNKDFKEDDDNDVSILPEFEFLPTLFTVFLISIPIIKKRKH